MASDDDGEGDGVCHHGDDGLMHMNLALKCYNDILSEVYELRSRNASLVLELDKTRAELSNVKDTHHIIVDEQSNIRKDMETMKLNILQQCKRLCEDHVAKFISVRSPDRDRCFVASTSTPLSTANSETRTPMLGFLVAPQNLEKRFASPSSRKLSTPTKTAQRLNETVTPITYVVLDGNDDVAEEKWASDVPLFQNWKPAITKTPTSVIRPGQKPAPSSFNRRRKSCSSIGVKPSSTVSKNEHRPIRAYPRSEETKRQHKEIEIVDSPVVNSKKKRSSVLGMPPSPITSPPDHVAHRKHQYAFRPGGPQFHFHEVVRNQADREKMIGHDCDECRKYWSIMGNGDPEKIKSIMQISSRHRAVSKPPPNTPDDFWDIDFPPTQDDPAQDWSQKNRDWKKNSSKREKKGNK